MSADLLSDGLDERIDRMTACRTMDEVRLAFRDAIAPDGFTASACGYFLPSAKGPGTHFYFQDWPPDWLELYVRENFVAHDYGVAEARRRIAPFVWSEAGRERVQSAGEKRIWRAFLDYGWTDGFGVPIHGPGGYFGLVMMAGRIGEWPAALRRRLHLLAFAAHERCRAIAGFADVGGSPAQLTARELECARWVAAGLSDPQIGRMLDIAPTTVKFHVDQARKKLGAKSRAHAVARLVADGML